MSALLPGRATPAGTARYVRRAQSRGAHDAAFRSLPGGQRVSVLGFGGYRVDDRDSNHHAALRHALEHGINLIDTSTNYAGGHSERLVGAVLREAITAGVLERDEVVVVSKAGYVQGPALAQARQRVEQGCPHPDMVRYAEDCWHCIHPDFLAEQLEASRSRLGLSVVDVYLLHNPEYLLMAQDGPADVGARRDLLHERLRAAFAFLREAVDRGLVGAFGVSSNGFPLPVSHPHHVSLTSVLAAARETAEDASGNGGLTVIQLPYNPVEDGAASDGNTPHEDAAQPVLQVAQGTGVAVLVNRPLNAIDDTGLRRLAVGPFEPERDHAAAFHAAATRLAVAERAAHERLRDPGLGRHAAGPWLLAQGPRIGSRAALGEALARYAVPPVEETAERLAGRGDEASAAQLRTRLRAVAAALAEWLNARDAESLRPLEARLDAVLPQSAREWPLSRKALAFGARTRGVTAVLNGMRRRPYVDDALAVMWGME